MNLYHYCSCEAFLQIIQNQTFRCSALSLSNDTMEGRWIAHIIDLLCVENKVGSDERKKLLHQLDFTMMSLDGLGFCMSERGDSLAQWRGYANDGAGFSIGFNKQKLIDMYENWPDHSDEPDFSVKKIIYNQDEQIELLMPAFETLRQFVSDSRLHPLSSINALLTSDADKNSREEERKKLLKNAIPRLLGSFIPHLFTQKNPAFEEEYEWRLLSLAVYHLDYSTINFSSSINSIKPYREFNFNQATGIVNEIVIGPRNRTPERVITSLLNSLGYNDVTIRNSSASYIR